MRILAAALLLGTSGGTWTFEKDAAGTPPAGFEFLTTAKTPPGRWEVREDGEGKVLAQLDEDPRVKARFAMAVAKDVKLKDLSLSVRGKPVAGKVDQSVGLVWRLQDADNYYVARSNALEQNVVLYKVVAGKRRELGGKDYVALKAGAWHTLKVEHKGDAIAVYLGADRIIEATDAALPEAGRVGVWIKADSVTHFDDLSAEELK